MSNVAPFLISPQLALPPAGNKAGESRDQELIELANVCKEEFRKMDIHKARHLIQAGKIFAKTKTEDRNFKIFIGIPEFSYANLDAAIALSKINGIENILWLGWKKLHYLYVNSTGIEYSKLSLADIQKEFGEITEETIEKGFIKFMLRSKTKFNAQKINELWNMGLRLDMVHDKHNLSKIQKSKNLPQTIKGIINNFEIKTPPVQKNDYDIYEKKIEKSTKSKIVLKNKNNYNYFINEELLMNDIKSAQNLWKKLRPIFKKERQEIAELFDQILDGE